MIGGQDFFADSAYTGKEQEKVINKYEMINKVNEKGYALIPTKVYFKNGKIKMTLALARGKRKYDKRETIKKRDEKRELDRIKKGED